MLIFRISYVDIIKTWCAFFIFLGIAILVYLLRQHCRQLRFGFVCGALAVAIWKWKVTRTLETDSNSNSSSESDSDWDSRSHKCVSIWPAYYLISLGPMHWQAFAHSPRRPIGSNWLWHFKCLFCVAFAIWPSQGLEDVVYACALCLIRAQARESYLSGHQSYKVDRNSGESLTKI